MSSVPQIVPVSDFRANIKSVSTYTDQGEVVILTQNGRPRWAMVDYDEWNAAARASEIAYARQLRATEEKERRGELSEHSGEDVRIWLHEHRSRGEA